MLISLEILILSHDILIFLHYPSLIRWWHPQIGQREIYQMLNGTRHVFPDFGTFVAMGFDTSDVVSIPHNVIALIPIGDPLPTQRQSLQRL